MCGEFVGLWGMSATARFRVAKGLRVWSAGLGGFCRVLQDASGAP